MVRFLPAALFVLGVVAATAAPLSVSRESVTLTFAGNGSPDGNNVSGARVDYIVKGDPVATIVLPPTEEGSLATATQLKLVAVPGEALPIAVVDPSTCARDCEESPIFLHRAAKKGALTRMQVLFATTDPEAAKAPLLAHWRVRRATKAYSWLYHSAIPIRPQILWVYTYIERTDGLHEIIGASFDGPADGPLPKPSPVPIGGCYESRGTATHAYLIRC